MTDTVNPTTPTADPAMRPITIEIPIAVAHRITETFEGTLEDAARAGLKLINGMGAAAYNNLHELAKQLDTSPAKALRSAIQLLVEDSARLNMTRGNVGRPKINEQRDAKLYERIKAGATQAEVAAEFGLSIVRVGQIVALHRVVSGDTPRRGRGATPNSRKSLGQPNLMRMYDELDAGMAVAVAAKAYELDEQRVRDLYTAYTAQLAGKAKITAYDRMQAAHQASLTPEVQLANKVEAQLKAAEFAAQATQAQARALEAQAKVAEAQAKAAEVLTLKEPPRKLAVIPPSMRNPELFAEAKPIKIPDPATVDMSMFDPNNPDFAI